MFINKNSFKINNVSIGQYLLQIEYERNKLWGSDTGRNMAGKTTGTLLGIVPKFKLTFRELSKTELETLAPILDSAFQSTTYYDPITKSEQTIETYIGDWGTLNRSTFTDLPNANESFEVSVIATTPKGY